MMISSDENDLPLHSLLLNRRTGPQMSQDDENSTASLGLSGQTVDCVERKNGRPKGGRIGPAPERVVVKQIGQQPARRLQRKLQSMQAQSSLLSNTATQGDWRPSSTGPQTRDKSVAWTKRNIPRNSAPSCTLVKSEERFNARASPASSSPNPWPGATSRASSGNSSNHLVAKSLVKCSRNETQDAPLSEENAPAACGSCPLTPSSYDGEAQLHFIPPKTSRPLKPPSQHRSITPPYRSHTQSKLSSPKKTYQQIPIDVSHRLSTDSGFWNTETVNNWTDQHSPAKKLTSPVKPKGLGLFCNADLPETMNTCLTSSQQRKMPKTQEAKSARKIFEETKHEIALNFLNELDKTITGGTLGRLTTETGGIHILWNGNLTSTAGRANWRREASAATQPEHKPDRAPSAYRHVASIELASKVITSLHRLRNVLAHEFCHLCNFMISNERRAPHGPSFKKWASQVTDTFQSKAIEVTTKHSYDIQYKYLWLCAGVTSDERTPDEGLNDCIEGCGAEYARHSRSINPQKHLCGRCKGRLVQVRPTPRQQNVQQRSETEMARTNAYQQFVKEQFQIVRAELGGDKSPSKVVMKEIAARYRAKKAEQHESKAIVLHSVELSDDESMDENTQEKGDLALITRGLLSLTVD